MKLSCDLHIHSALSPCGDSEMTPLNIVNMAKIMGYDAIALTDHNSSKNCGAVIEAGKEIGVTVIAGMELCTSEEVHAICLFPALDNANKFSDYIYNKLPNIKNKPDIFGKQLIFDNQDNIIGEEEKLLITASSISISSVASLVSEYEGICFPAHIDRSSFSIISNLGTIDESFGFKAAEIYEIEKAEELVTKFPYLQKLKLVSNSDAHYLESFRLPNPKLKITATENTAKDILKFFK